jgi:acylphosphatase
MKRPEGAARRYFVRGRVQGVGYRDFVQRAASGLGLTGYARNLDDGRVEVFAVGAPEHPEQLSSRLRKGPLLSDVRGVEEQDSAVQQYDSFYIR